jgi:hypothetical protein
MDPLTVNDLSLLIEQKPTIKILVKIEKCKINEFEELMWDSICWQFLHKVVKLRHDTSVGRALTVTQQWARSALYTRITTQVIINPRIHGDADANYCRARRMMMTRARMRLRLAKAALPSMRTISLLFEESSNLDEKSFLSKKGKWDAVPVGSVFLVSLLKVLTIYPTDPKSIQLPFIFYPPAPTQAHFVTKHESCPVLNLFHRAIARIVHGHPKSQEIYFLNEEPRYYHYTVSGDRTRHKSSEKHTSLQIFPFGLI